MADIYIVKSVTEKQTLQDDISGNQVVRYLTLGDKNPASGNRYYVSLTGQDAEIEWHEGDSIMVELWFVAYKSHGQWHMSNRSDSIKLVEIGNISNNKIIQDNE